MFKFIIMALFEIVNNCEFVVDICKRWRMLWGNVDWLLTPT